MPNMPATLNWEALLWQDYPTRIGTVLQHAGLVKDAAEWRQAVARCQHVGDLRPEVAAAIQEPAIVPTEDGTYLLELWHSADLGVTPSGYGYWVAYCIENDLQDDGAAYLWVQTANVLSAYCDLVQDGIVAPNKRINVCCSTSCSAFVACVAAQQLGAPIYTVVGADGADRLLHKVQQRSLPLPESWQSMRLWAQGGNIAALTDVLAAYCDRDERMGAMAFCHDEMGYLAHPATAEAYHVAQLYRQEAESRHIMVVLACRHPYSAPQEVCLAVCERQPRDDEEALRLLQEETGWEVPDALQTPADPDIIRQQLQP